jgi:uncharacterized protein YabN with tetrapyrrole methylase and pyrophosphatase domain
MGDSRKDYDVYVLGLGILSSLHVTRETEQTLRLCKKVFFLHPEARWVQKYLESLCSDVVNLDGCYSEGGLRGHAYERMVETVLAAARENPPVGVAFYGHPLIFVSPSRTIIERAPEAGLSAQMLPALSTLDCMFVDLDVDPSDGLILYEVNEMLLRRRPLLPDIHCFLWQPGTVESEVFTRRINRPNRFLRLKSYLLQFYPADHPATIITCAMTPLVGPKLTEVRLDQLETKSLQLHAGATLYIPPVTTKLAQDEQFRRLLHSEEHLATITDESPLST